MKFIDQLVVSCQCEFPAFDHCESVISKTLIFGVLKKLILTIFWGIVFAFNKVDFHRFFICHSGSDHSINWVLMSV